MNYSLDGNIINDQFISNKMLKLGNSVYFGLMKEVDSNQRATTILGFGETILVVNDVEDQREIMREMLKILGYQVTCVPSGEGAVNFLMEIIGVAVKSELNG